MRHSFTVWRFSVARRRGGSCLVDLDDAVDFSDEPEAGEEADGAWKARRFIISIQIYTKRSITLALKYIAYKPFTDCLNFGDAKPIETDATLEDG